MQIVLTERANHARDLLQTLPLAHLDGVISVGGDGMFAEVGHIRPIIRVADRVANPDLFGPTVSGSYRYSGNVKLYKQGKNILKIEVLHIFRRIFPFFQIKIIIIQISEEVCVM